MITHFEFKEIIEDYVKKETIFNMDTLDKYIKKIHFSQYVHNINKNKAKGDIFEWICKYFLIKEGYENVYLNKEIPIGIRAELKIGNIDRGIDIICKLNDVWFGVQSKWRDDIGYAIDKNLVVGAVIEIVKHNLLVPIVMTNVKNPTKYEIKVHNKVINVGWMMRDYFRTIDEEFFNGIVKDKPIKKEVINNKIVLRDYQVEAIENLKASGDKNKQCIMACGTGKSVIMIEYIKGYDKVLIMLPSLQLVSQMYKKINATMTYKIIHNKKVLDKKVLCICSDLDREGFVCGETKNAEIGREIMNDFIAQDITVQYTTDIEIINNTLQLNNLIVLCTYQSGALLKGSVFNLGVFDEAHKTVANPIFSFALNDNNVKITERLYMTATVRYNETDKKVISMNNKDVYGDTVYEYSFKKAIEEKNILDFQVITYVVPKELEEIATNRYIKKDGVIIESNILISAMMLAEHIKTNGNCKKILTYHNSVNNALTFKKTLRYIFDKFGLKGDVYCLSGNTKMKQRTQIFDSFENSTGLSIICSAKVLNEGVDIPCVDTVMFVDARNSTIDVTQCVGRGMRLYKNQEKCSVIVPINYESIGQQNNYSGILRILSAMAYIDDKLIENIVVGNMSNKIIVKNMKNIMKMIHVGEINYNDSNYDIKYSVDDLYGKLKIAICDSERFAFEYRKNLFFEYCNKTGKITTAKSNCTDIGNDNNIWIGLWYQKQKRKKIFSINDTTYKILSVNPIVKDDLDRYLQGLEKRKNQLDDDEMCELVIKFCEIEKRAPRENDIQDGQPVGKWLIGKKSKGRKLEPELMDKLNENEHVRQNFENYAKFKKKYEGYEFYKHHQWVELLFDYVKQEGKAPEREVIHNDHKLGKWYIAQRCQIVDNNSPIYKELEHNPIIKSNLDIFIESIGFKRERRKITQSQKCDMIIEYVKRKNKIPVETTKDGDYPVGQWFCRYKYEIKHCEHSKEHQFYIKLSQDKNIKNNIDEYLNGDVVIIRRKRKL